MHIRDEEHHMNWINTTAGDTAEKLAKLNQNINDYSVSGFGLKVKVERLIRLLRSALFPNIYCESSIPASQVQAYICLNIEKAGLLLMEICSDILNNPRTNHKSFTESEIGDVTEAFLSSLPEIYAHLHTDVIAAYEGDPAAKSTEEILLAYPSFEAISVFRLAHRLQELGVPMLPRMMTEYAHSKTGIDIHPGATIGDYFFIDHGTGVVIGETTIIGEHVKLYQGVTLGARSFPLDEHGNPIKGIQRHPKIGNNVVIYAHATILGGDTVIGDDCVIGANVWITHSVEAGSTVNSSPFGK